jgi:hypothetical protein
MWELEWNLQVRLYDTIYVGTGMECAGPTLRYQIRSF